MIEPKLRFKADDESQFPDWEEKKISDIFSKVKEKNKDGQNQNVITNSAEFGLINQRDFFDKDIAVDGKTENYTVIKTGDFVYNPRKSKQAPYGPFNCYHLEKDGIVSPLYTCLRPKGIADNEYLQWYFQSGSWYRFIYENGAQNGARHDRVGMTDSLMQEIPVHLPQLAEEQQKIAEFLSTIDTVIAKQKETVSAWEERKKGVMQKLFSQEVRFKADDGSNFPEWEEKKLNEIAVRVTRKNKDNVTDIPLTISSADGLIDQRNFFNKVVASKDMSGYFLLKNGEFAYNKSYSKGYNFGSIKRLDLYDEGALSTLYICFALNKNENSDFYQKYFDSLSWYPELQKICAEGARNHGLLNVPTNDFFQLKLCVPSSDKEQHKIADCLSSLDEVIEKQKETLVAWEELKKGLLQQMFV